MRCFRSPESSVLGYHVERVDEFDEMGMLRSMRFEVMCPFTGVVLGSHPSLRAARKHVVLHELRAARELRERHYDNVA